MQLLLVLQQAAAAANWNQQMNGWAYGMWPYSGYMANANYMAAAAAAYTGQR